MAFYAAAARQAASRMVSDVQIDHTTQSVTSALKKRRAANEKERNVVFGVHSPPPILNPDEVFLFADDQDEVSSSVLDLLAPVDDSFEGVKKDQLQRLEELRQELEALDEHRTEEDIEQEIMDEDEDLDTLQRHVEVNNRFKYRQAKRRQLAKKMFELQANLEAQGLIRDLMNPHAKSVQKGQHTTSVLTAVTTLVIDQSYEQVSRRKSWIMGAFAILQCFLVLLMLQIPWDDELLVYDNDHTAIVVIEVFQSVLTAILLYLLVDYYRHLAKWEAVKMNLPPEVASIWRYDRFPFLIAEMLICVIHPFPYLYVRKLALLVFFRLYILIRVYRDASRIYKWRREIQSHENVKSRINFDAWFSIRALFHREPWFALIVVTIVTVCFFAYCLYINERESIDASLVLKGFVNAGCTVTCPPSGVFMFDGGQSVTCIPQDTIVRPECPSTGHFAEYRSCLYFVALTMTTIGIGEQVAITNWGRIFLMVSALFGMAIAGTLLTAIIRAITLNYAQKYSADFCALKHLAIQEQHLAARVIQQFFREGLKSGQLRRMALRNRAAMAQTRRGSLGMAPQSPTNQNAKTGAGSNQATGTSTSPAPAEIVARKKLTMRNAATEEEKNSSCCSHSEFEVRIEQFKRYRLTAAQQIGQEDGTQIKHMFAMRTFAGNTAMTVEDIASKQIQMTNHVQRMATALLTTIQAFTAKTVESMRRSGAAKKSDVGNTEQTLTHSALRGAFATSLANNRVTGLGLAPLPTGNTSPKGAEGPLVKDESMGIFYVFS